MVKGSNSIFSRCFEILLVMTNVVWNKCASTEVAAPHQYSKKLVK